MFFFLCGILCLTTNLLVGVAGIIFSFCGLFALYSENKNKNRTFFEINSNGISYLYGGMKQPQNVDWSNIADVKLEEPMGKLTGFATGSRGASGLRGVQKHIGIKLKDPSVIEAYNKHPYLTQLGKDYVSDFDVLVPSPIFDVGKIYPLLIKYWKDPQARTELGSVGTQQNNPGAALK